MHTGAYGSRPGRAGRRGKFPRRIQITSQQFRDARVFSGLARDEAAELLGVSLRTVGHWETGKSRPAYAAFKLLRVYRHGDLIDPLWSGFSIIRGRLVTPENHSFQPCDMAWLSLLVRRAHAFSELARQCRRAASGADRAGTRASAATTARTGAPLGSADPLAGQQRNDAGAPIFPRDLSSGVAVQASGASLGLVSSSTSRTAFEEVPVTATFQPLAGGPIMGPQWGHESAQGSTQQAQSPDAAGSPSRRGSTSRSDGFELECLRAPSPAEFHSVHGPADAGGRTNKSHAARGFAPIGDAAQTSVVRVAQGRPKRPVPVRLGPQGEAVPSGIVLTAGGGA